MRFLVEFKQNKGDYLLALTALLQPFFALFQLFLVDALKFDENAANKIRMLVTAIPIVLSMLLVARRNMKSIAVVYIPVLFVLLLTSAMWIGRWEVMQNDVTKFLLPVVIPSGLCIACIKNLQTFVNSCFYVAIATAGLGVLYFYYYLSGSIDFDMYSMTFSYSLLLPVIILATRDNVVWKLVSVALLFIIFSIGSRGVLLIILFYYFFLYMWKKGKVTKMFIYGAVAIGLVMMLANQILSLLISLTDLLGINSRTLFLLMNGDFASDSGRAIIRNEMWKLIDNYPIFGMGVWADRQYVSAYPHNIFIELLVHFGYVGAFFLILWFVVSQYKTFRCLNRNHKLIYLMFFIGTEIGFLSSGSYLTDPNFGLMLGISYMLRRMNGSGMCQDVTINSF